MIRLSFLTQILAVSSVVSLGSLVAAEPVDVSKIPPAATVEKVDFAKQIKPLLEKSCLSCHGEKRPKSKYRVDSREALIKGGSSEEAAIIVGKSEKSPLIHFVVDLVEEMEMPPLPKRKTNPAWTKEQIGVVRAWIDQGALWPKEIKLELPKDPQ